jgi:uncharacterized membrane protein YagU involved in acid resistance
MLVSMLRGGVAGLLATAPMTVVMAILFRFLPRHEQYPLPPRQIEERVSHEAGIGHRMDEGEHRVLTTLAHFGYGALTGAGYGLVAHALRPPPLLAGSGFGLVVWLVSYLGWLPALKILPSATEQPGGRNMLMITAHLVWGAVLGWLTQRLDRRGVD